jgi:hypothetical protein
MFDVAQKSLKLLLEMMTVVLSANIMGSVKVFIVEGRSSMYIMKSKVPRIAPLGTPCFNVPQFEKKILIVCRRFTLTFCFLSVRWDLNHFAAIP